jgi:hypothetical protein
LLQHFGLGGIAGLVKFKKYASIFYNGRQFLKLVCPNFFYFDGCQYLFGFFRVIPKMWTNGYFLLFFQQLKLLINVKDASSGTLLCPLNPELVL